ncbi:uncharacterized protein MCYG_00986 [Microsporum canis CBS 113480]|uniref:Uncharacterized protein n=1 Tax=Arthroderma otae (strain ATCC MYA-4605 / CBS 113480) TaxID=554155 RepID=C5FE64_ARTOC|nr:uncharacterized protein MCYG_00986 [Microsporum canis CBS 113480]EEQ28098.1 predicted protein [Microsporum canis CBS 113480]
MHKTEPGVCLMVQVMRGSSEERTSIAVRVKNERRNGRSGVPGVVLQLRYPANPRAEWETRQRTNEPQPRATSVSLLTFSASLVDMSLLQQPHRRHQESSTSSRPSMSASQRKWLMENEEVEPCRARFLIENNPRQDRAKSSNQTVVVT